MYMYIKYIIKYMVRYFKKMLLKYYKVIIVYIYFSFYLSNIMLLKMDNIVVWFWDTH